jgi:predicted component of type VI protein secretion system
VPNDLFDAPSTIAAHLAHLAGLRATDLPDESAVGQRTLAAVAAVLFERAGLVAEVERLRAKLAHFGVERK